MKNYSKWKDQEVVELFRFVEKQKAAGECLTNIFINFAKQTKRMPNSVRNYYYAELCNLMQNPTRCQKLQIDISLHKKIEPKEFTEDETKTVVTKILQMTAKGMSVRKACQTLANGEISLMVRYQNKFRSVVQKDKTMYNSCLQRVGEEVKLKTKTPNNIIKMPDRRNVLTESDINSLFLGLVKLVKKQTQDDLCKTYEKDKQKANDMLRKTLVEIAEKDNIIKQLRKQFKVLKQEKEQLCEEIKILRGKTVELKVERQKLSALKKFTQRYEQKIATEQTR
ncbi:MAG: hypothetical protein J6Q51_00780 [Clostridia bacterium]|nr:hypothetical protein [Clostridia bacterium]